MNAVNEPRFADLHAPLPADRVAAVIERLSRILPAHALLHRAEDTRTSKASTFVRTTSSPCRWEVLKIRPSGAPAVA
jgi:hypothetical protein